MTNETPVPGDGTGAQWKITHNQPQNTAGPYASAAPIYLEVGWHGCIPVDPADKGGVPAGFTGRGGGDATPENVAWWVRSKPGHNVGLRLPADLVGIDVDAYGNKRGAETLADAVARWGALPATYVSTSRDDGVSGIRLYRVPAGVELVADLGAGSGVELIQRHHRHVQCWPSRHVDTGQTYHWHAEIDGGVLDRPPAPTDIPDLPAAWLDGLRAEAPRNGAEIAAGELADVPDCLTPGDPSPRVQARLDRALTDCATPGERHNRTRDSVLTLLRLGQAGETGVLAALTTLRNVFAAYVVADGSRGQAEAVDEFNRMINRPRVAELLAEPDYEDWFDAVAASAAATNGAAALVSDTTAATTGDPPALPEPTTWEAADLGPWLRGEVEQPTPTLGLARADGLRLLYPGREHAVLGETEAGKSWFALACVAAELRNGRHVVYIHFEEPDPASTIERLGLLGVGTDVMAERLRFVAPARPLSDLRWLSGLLDPAPSLVVHDGVNEGMALQGCDIMTAEGAAAFRRWLVTPCVRAGAATLALDHLPKSRESSSRDAYGSVHKGNALDGARFVLDNVAPFGRGLRGASHLAVTKDRPGHLRARGQPSKVGGKTYVGTLVIDDSGAPFAPLSLSLSTPDSGESTAQADDGMAATVFDVVAAQPDRTVSSERALLAAMRAAGHKVRDGAVRAAVDDLLHDGRLTEVRGSNRAKGYRASAAHDET